jgi:hypothetical protein
MPPNEDSVNQYEKSARTRGEHVFVRGAGLSDLETGFVAGFLEAEGHFTVTPTNAGQSYSCIASVAARDDDAELIVALRDRAGVGCLSRRPGVRTSRPQIIWTIAARAECSTLAELLARNPPIGRKAAICRSSCEAVDIWRNPAPGRALHLQRVREELRAAAAYCAEPRPARALDPHNDLDRGYVTGLLVGDGHFRVAPDGARLTVHLRDDDRPFLRSIQDALGVSTRSRSSPLSMTGDSTP